MSFRDEVRVGLIKKGMTQTELAKALNISYGYLQEILRGTRQPKERIEQIRVFLNIDLEEEE